MLESIRALVKTTCEAMLAAREVNKREGNTEQVTLTITYAEINMSLQRMRITKSLRAQLVEEFKLSQVQVLAFDFRGLTLRTLPEGSRTEFGSLQEIQKYGTPATEVQL